ncbi:U5 small nuclear ribonucleoprotein subunit [Heterostelium album PN500]|uniref:116 kDa U5 small nuclear ribonucleoprotein component n=1 Tax=Heterostelium pallidum (strain ATCC 26659 / Pp 5 / PN500) TaxID=670386 RepID=D3BFQ2_HETP5|nr:U5 small nuclear ribonucleoprotein subunit [Heterostelium album PN500]EFA79966.1 U5 small nuclear ribonucleoprotein subunit [Heterostelium album PN500]|eukprot:XP_020432086.1 U5 small nuclear ribonucleoprotein subunit [Heterostelium album PN500]
MSDQPLFDEFGNLIEDDNNVDQVYNGEVDEDQFQAGVDDDEGNDLTGIDMSRDDADRDNDEDHDHHSNGLNGNGRQQNDRMEVDNELKSNAIVLHEDKKYFPDASEVYHGAEVMVQDEDTQPISKPIIAPTRTRTFALTEQDLPTTTYDKQFLIDLLQYPHLIRNVCLVGNLSSGKTSFMDMLFLQTHEKKWTHTKPMRYTDTRKDEQERRLSIKSTPMTLVLQNSKDKSYVCNILDTPGHVNFSDEVTASMRLCDSAVIVVDALEGVMMQTERLIQHAVNEGLSIAVIINKVDRLILELRLPPTDAYFKIKHTIDEINQILDKASHGSQSIRVSPEAGNVLFASSEMGWCFTLSSFAKIYSVSFGGGFAPEEFAKRLWGDLYFHADKRVFRRKPDNPEMQRSFIHFILNPLYKIYSTVVSSDKAGVERMLFELGMRLPRETLDMDVKPLLRIVLGTFFGKSQGFVDMLTTLPSPLDAAPTKTEMFYTGPQIGEYGESLKKCDPNGPLVLHITKLICRPDGVKFDSLARVMSGTVTKGMVRVLGEKYTPDNDEDLVLDEITKISISEARYQIEVEQAYPGSWVLLEGVDNSIVKTATVVAENDIDSREPDTSAHIFRPLQFNTKSVCKVAIEPLNPSELPKMLEGLRKINKSYPLAITRAEESGEHIILGTGELYLDCILHDLRTMYAEIEIKVDDPVICLSETIAETSAIRCRAETQNRKNSLTMICEPLEKGLADDIESGAVKIDWPKKKRSEFFQTKYGWDLLAANNIWAFGPDTYGPNVLINDTFSTEINRSHLMSISESVVRGFQWATKEGPLVDEPVRNTKFKLIDATIAPEPIARSSGHIVPAARSATHSAFLVANPRLMEPIFMVEVISPPDCVQAIETVLTRRRGHIIHDFPKPGTPLYITKALLPVLDSYGFETDLRSHTQGQAFCLSTFDHWQVVPGDPLDKSIVLQPLEPSPQAHLARELLIKTRRRKGLSEDVNLSKHFDDEQLLQLAHQMGEL